MQLTGMLLTITAVKTGLLLQPTATSYDMWNHYLPCSTL